MRKIAGKALLIGIDRYPCFPKARYLEGAVNDVRRMREYLEGLGFSAADIRTLCNKGATRRGIQQGMADLLQQVDPDDLVVVHYSGHGSQKIDSTSLEANRRLECLVPYDSGHHAPHPNRDITCLEIAAWLRQLKAVTSRILIVVDSCHSGTITRESQGLRERWVEPDERVTTPGQDIEEWPWSVENEALTMRGDSGWLAPAGTHTLIAGCRCDESAYEMPAEEAGGHVHGALTFFLLAELKAANLGATTYRDVHEIVRLLVNERFYRQHPQLEGAADRLLFQCEELSPMRYLSVLRRSGEYVTLWGGEIHSLGEGSMYAVYPPATKTPEENCLGRVVVETVQGVWSTARVLEETSPASIVPGARAVEQEGVGTPRVSVRVTAAASLASQAKLLETALRTSQLLCLATPEAEPDFTVHFLVPRTDAYEGDPAWRLTQIDAPACVIVDDSNEIQAPWHQLEEPSALDRTLANLEERARYRRALELCNSRPNVLEGKVEMTLLRQVGFGGWEKAEPRNPMYEETDFDHEEGFGLKIVNHHNEDVFIYVLSFGVGGSVDPLYPVDEACEPLAPGVSIHLGAPPQKGLTFYVPSGYPFHRPGSAEPGIETLKLFATLETADLRPIFQEGLRNHSDGLEELTSGPLGEELSRIFLGREYREVRRGPSARHAAWTTVEIPLVLQRR